MVVDACGPGRKRIEGRGEYRESGDQGGAVNGLNNDRSDILPSGHTQRLLEGLEGSACPNSVWLAQHAGGCSWRLAETPIVGSPLYTPP